MKLLPILVLTLVMSCQYVHSFLNEADFGKSKQNTDDVSSDESEEVEPFVATKEWQRIKPGQTIPSGLHIKMDMTNGGKWAKLMDSENESGLAIVPDQKQPDDHKSDIKASYNIDELKSALKHLKEEKVKNSTVSHEDKVKSKFRTIEEIRETFDQLNLQEEGDVEVMKKLLAIVASKDEDVEKKHLALQDLEYYVHQIDNANDLVQLGGFPILVRALNDSHAAIREEAAHIIGSAVQSNPKVQIKAIENDVLRILLLKLSSKQEVMAVRKKCLFAISSLVRHFPIAQWKLSDYEGFEILIKLFDEEGAESLQLKAIRLISDLVDERTHAAMSNDEGKEERIKQLNRLQLNNIIRRQGWCSAIASTLKAKTHSQRETVLMAMKSLINNCKEEFQRVSVIIELQRLKSEYESLSIEEANKDENDGYFISLLDITKEILEMLKTDLRTKAEL